jgi:hypothetical protein
MVRNYSWYGYAGWLFMLSGWAGNWFGEGLRTHIFFFPQWLGFILLVDAWVLKRTDSSLVKRDLKKFISLFFISIPVWWLFELLNVRVQNWFYVGREHFNNTEYFLLASLNFSIVIPAVFEVTELLTTFRWTKKLKRGPVIADNRKTAKVLIVLGVSLLALDLFWPRYFYLFTWVSVYLVVEGINILLNKNSLIRFTSAGNWYPLYMLALGCLCCGILWECWNFYSYPKWIYKIPYVDFLRIFEMPLLGYLGYIPFAFELYSIYMFFASADHGKSPYIIVH